MTKQNEIYKCNICGNLTEVMHESSGELVCCNKSMRLLKENTTDAATEKHIPVYERNGNEVFVFVGEVEHPMESVHYIEFIQIMTNKNNIYTSYLSPGEKPQAIFTLREDEEIIKVREHCNLHGLWAKLK